MEFCFHVWASQCKKDIELPEWVQQRAMERNGGLEHLWEAEKAEAAHPGEEKTQGELINVCKQLMGGNEEAGTRRFSVKPSDTGQEATYTN